MWKEIKNKKVSIRCKNIDYDSIKISYNDKNLASDFSINQVANQFRHHNKVSFDNFVLQYCHGGIDNFVSICHKDRALFRFNFPSKRSKRINNLYQFFYIYESPRIRSNFSFDVYGKKINIYGVVLTLNYKQYKLALSQGGKVRQYGFNFKTPFGLRTRLDIAPQGQITYKFGICYKSPFIYSKFIVIRGKNNEYTKSFMIMGIKAEDAYLELSTSLSRNYTCVSAILPLDKRTEYFHKVTILDGRLENSGFGVSYNISDTSKASFYFKINHSFRAVYTKKINENISLTCGARYLPNSENYSFSLNTVINR